MAVLFPDPNVFLTKSLRGVERDGEPKKWRMCQDRIADLRAVATGIEETDVGISCKYLFDARSGAGADYDEVTLDPVELFCERGEVWNRKKDEPEKWRYRIRRCRVAIEKMYQHHHTKHVAVLFIVYGYQDPSTRELPLLVQQTLGELVSLARYSDVVEVRRQEMARHEGISRAQATWVVHTDDTAIRSDAFRHNMRPEIFAPLVEIIDVRDRVEWANKAISSGEALRAMFGTVMERAKKETEDHFLVRKENFEKKQTGWIQQIKREMTLALDTASKVYYKYWSESA